MTTGSQSGAFFDLDGTLLAAPSLEWQFVAYLFAHNRIGAEQIVRWAAHCAKTVWRDPRAAIQANKFYLAGLSESLAMIWENSLAPDSDATDTAKRWSLRIFSEGIERIAWHLAQGHRIVFVTGTLAPLAHAFGQILLRRSITRPAEVCATRLDTRVGVWTGRIAGQHMSGWEKAMALREFVARHNLSLAKSYAYGDSWTDLPMLETVGNPIAVNPEPRLARFARRRGWPVRDWRSLDRSAMSIAPTNPAAAPTVTPAGKPSALTAEEAQ